MLCLPTLTNDELCEKDNDKSEQGATAYGYQGEYQTGNVESIQEVEHRVVDEAAEEGIGQKMTNTHGKEVGFKLILLVIVIVRGEKVEQTGLDESQQGIGECTHTPGIGKHVVDDTETETPKQQADTVGAAMEAQDGINQQQRSHHTKNVDVVENQDLHQQHNTETKEPIYYTSVHTLGGFYKMSFLTG